MRLLTALLRIFQRSTAPETPVVIGAIELPVFSTTSPIYQQLVNELGDPHNA